MEPVRNASRGAGETRGRIAVTAERLFRTLGYQKTTVADIARELGMSPANVYRFFASKSAINEAIAERLLSEMGAEMAAIAGGAGTATQRLRRLLSFSFERKMALFFEERRMHDMVSASIQEHWDVVERHMVGVHESIGRVLADGMAGGEFARLDPAATAHRIMHAMVAWNHPLVVESCIVHRGQTVELLRSQVADMTDFLLRALRP